MQVSNKLIAIVAIMALLSLTSVVVYQQGQVRNLEKQLNDELISHENVNNEPGATVYWYVQRAGESSFSLYYSEHNVITNAGRTALRPYIGQTAGAAFDYIAVGTGSGGGASSTGLVTEFTRSQGTYATVGSYNFTITKTFAPGTFSGQTITEAGVFNAASGPTILSYQDFTGITLQAGDSLQVQFNFQVGG